MKLSLDAMQNMLSLLENYYFDGDSGSVPFIVLDGYFAKVGYDIGESQLMIDAIKSAIAGKTFPSDITDIYYFQTGRHFINIKRNFIMSTLTIKQNLEK